jgi:putative ABC transport system permease protein
MGIPLRAGRPISEADHPRKVAILSERAAARIWPGQDPIGKRFRRGNPGQPPFEVIGVAGDIRGVSLQEEPGPMVYVAYWERIPRRAAIAIRTTADPRFSAGLLKEAVHSLDAQLPVSAIQTMQQVEDGSLAGRRFQMLLIAAFAGSALLLAALGMYGVLAYSVARRTNELGVRMALGARQGAVMAMVLRQAITPVLLGLAAGIVCALALGRIIAGLLFSVSPSDPKTIAGVAVITIAAALAAAWVPARRATRIDPLIALRYE